KLQTFAHGPCQRQQPQHHETQTEVVSLGQRVQSRQHVGKAKQADRACEKEESAGRDGGNRHDVKRETHALSSEPGPSVSKRDIAFLTNAMEANVARSARVNATSIAAGTPLSAPSSSNAAMPPLPISCAAMIRSASPGPRRTRTSPTARTARTKPSAAVRNSVITDGPQQRGFLRSQLRYDRLTDIDAVIDKGSIVISGR